MTVDLISKCSGSSGCSGTDIADTVFAVLGTIGGLVIAFGGPAAPIGVIIAAVAAIGSFIASFFKPDPVRPVPGLDAAAVEAAAFRAVQRAEDTTTFALFANFANALRTANEFNADIEKQIGDLKATATDAEVDKLVDGWFDQYHNYKWEGEWRAHTPMSAPQSREADARLTPPVLAVRRPGVAHEGLRHGVLQGVRRHGR